MRPLQLTIEGLRSFRAPAQQAKKKEDAAPRKPTIDFTGRDHVAIVGDTGAGKSSILEAITYALYGQTTFAAQANQELMNDTSTHLRVVLRFRVAGETWEVARTLKKAGSGDVGQVRASLRRLGDDGSPVEQLEHVRRVNERIEKLLGLDADAFLRTVVLPQGRFARLLVEDKPSARSQILRQVWRTDELEAAGELAGRARREVQTLCVRLEQAAGAYPADPEAHLERLREDLGDARRRAAEAAKEEKTAADALQAVQAAERDGQAAAEAAARLRALPLGDAAERLAPIAALQARLAERETDLQERQARLEKKLADIPTDDGPTREEVATALTRLEILPALAAACERAAGALRSGVEEASTKRADAGRLAETAAASRQRADAHAAGRPALNEACEAARERRNAVEQRHARCVERAGDLDAARKRFDTRRAEERACAGRLEAAQEAARRADADAAAAEERLAAARRAESAAAAAHGLHTGDACPICLRDLPAGWQAPGGAGLAEAEDADARARTTAGTAGREAAALEAQRRSIEARAADAATDVAAADARLREARHALAQAAELGADAALPERETLLAPLEAACRETSEALAAHDRAGKALETDATAQDKAAGVAQEAASAADALADRSRRNAVEAMRNLRAGVAATPAAFRPHVALPDDPADLLAVDTAPVAAQTQAAQDRAGVLEARRRERDRLQREIAGTQAARAALAQDWADEVEAPLDALSRDLNAHRDVLLAAAHRLELAPDVPAAVAARDVGALETHVGRLRAAAADLSRAADEHARGAVDRSAAARRQLAGIGERLDAGIDTDDPAAVADCARRRAEDARFEERRARQQEEHFAGIVDDVLRLRTLLQEAQERERALGDLEDALKPGAFLKWLTLRRSRRLLVHASRMLGEMSGGKYAFVDPGETEERWRVLDRESGQDRSPASLSGGEQFIASLSLALGMVEMMARSGGRLESLFLDEGFGSLDRNNLDAAVQALGTVAAGGRMVGVISHVRAVAEQIEHVLAVTRSAAGSRVEWLSNRQRQALAEAGVGPEAAAALGGLLE